MNMCCSVQKLLIISHPTRERGSYCIISDSTRYKSNFTLWYHVILQDRWQMAMSYLDFLRQAPISTQASFFCIWRLCPDHSFDCGNIQLISCNYQHWWRPCFCQNDMGENNCHNDWFCVKEFENWQGSRRNSSVLLCVIPSPVQVPSSRQLCPVIPFSFDKCGKWTQILRENSNHEPRSEVISPWQYQCCWCSHHINFEFG